jgi:hypothetical protein
MGRSMRKKISMAVKSIMEDVIISPSKYTSITGRTVEDYVALLIDNYVDTTGMKDEEIILLHKYLSDAVRKEIDEIQSKE